MTGWGYPRIVKEWKRGTPLSQAAVSFEGKTTDVGVEAFVVNEKGRQYDRVRRSITFWEGEDFIRVGGKWVRIHAPADADVATANGLVLVKLKTVWTPAKTTYAAGALIGMNLDRFLSGERDFEVIYAPAERAALQSFTLTRDMIVLDVLDNVKSRVTEVRREGGRWVKTNVPVPPAASIGVAALDRGRSHDYWMTVTSFLQPPTPHPASPGTNGREKPQGLPELFNANRLT